MVWVFSILLILTSGCQYLSAHPRVVDEIQEAVAEITEAMMDGEEPPK